MSTILLHLLSIAVIFTVVTDISDFPNSVKKGISWLLTKGKIVKSDFRVHLVDCSLCQCTWAGFIYLLCVGKFTLPYIALVLMVSTFCGVIKSIILVVEDIITKIIQLIYKHWIDK